MGEVRKTVKEIIDEMRLELSNEDEQEIAMFAPSMVKKKKAERQPGKKAKKKPAKKKAAGKKPAKGKNRVKKRTAPGKKAKKKKGKR